MNPLTPEQIRELTGKIYPAAQKRELDRLGIPAKRRSDGSVLVLESVVNACFSDLADAKVSSSKDEPNWGALSDDRPNSSGEVKTQVRRTGSRRNSVVFLRRKGVPVQRAEAGQGTGDPDRDASQG